MNNYETKQDSERPCVDRAKPNFARERSAYYGMSVDSTKRHFSEACQGRGSEPLIRVKGTR
jgi:hypothetical protein